MEVRRFITRKKLTFLRNLARVRVFDPRLVLKATRLAEAARQRGAVQKRTEFAPLIALLLRRPPQRVVEVGRGAGGSLWALCQVAVDDATIVSVDLPHGPYGGRSDDAETLARYESYASPGQEILLIQGDSRATETVEKVHGAIGSVDLLFIDGDHTFDGVKGDYDAYSSLVRPGGLVVFHDILPHDSFPEIEVHTFWSDLDGRKIELVSPSEVSSDGGRWGGIGVLFAS